MAPTRQGGQRLLLQVLIHIGLIGLIALIINACSGNVATSGPPPTPTLAPTSTSNSICTGTPNTVSCSNQSDLAIDVGHASEMHVQDTQEIRVELYSKSHISIANDPLPTANIPAENATVTTTPVVPVGTPETRLVDAFGPGYSPYATAKLTANKAQFTISPINYLLEEQPLYQSAILWAWLVTANTAGTSILDVDISVIWKSLSANLSKQGPWSIGDQQIRIQVTEPIPTPTPTPTLAPTPTPTHSPTLAPTRTSAPTTEGLQLQTASNIAQLVGVLWVLVFGGKAAYEVIGKRPRLRFPSALTITNILLAAILLVLLSLFFHPHLIP